MTVKQKFDKIDQSKLLQAQVDILKSMQAKTDNFKTKDKEALEKIEMGLDKIIAKLQESNPNALKSTGRKTTTAKTATKSTKGRKTAMQLAKEIRKPNESWNEAVKRAGSMMRGDAKQASKVVTSELEKLKAFVNRRKQLKGIAGTDLLRDATRKAKPKGSRKSKDGNVYYEYRENRTDRLAPNYPKNTPLLADGGGVDELDEYNIFIIKMDTASAVNKVYKVLTEYGIKIDVNKEWHTKGYGQEYYPTGNYGYPFTYVVDRRDAKNPKEFEEKIDSLVSKTIDVLSSPVNYYEFANGGGVDGIEEDIDMTDDYVLRVNKGVQPKDRASLREFMAKTNESREAMAYELGGATMQYDLAGNTGGGTAGLNADMPLSGVSGTHYTGLVGETGALSSGEMFAGGGGVGNEEKLLKELYKLQRELNSRQLQTYRLGDTSDEEIARKRERASKLERFNEVLKELNDKEIKHSRGGSTDHKYLNHSQDYEVRYAKGKGRHGYGNLKFANGGAMMANQQIIDNASQQYVNYYLGEGATAGMYARGGMMPKVSTKKHRND